MHFISDKNEIMKEINNARDFSAQKNAVSVLSNVYLKLEGDKLIVKSTDQKSGYMSEISVQGIADGELTVPCDKLSDILKTLPDSEIVFERKDDKFSIKPENSSIEFTLRIQDASVFPFVQMPGEDTYFRVSKKDFTEMINQVIFAVSDDESKFAMTGALLERTDESLVMVATDGRRLSFINRKINSNVPMFSSVVIPSKFLDMIRKRSDGEGDLELSVEETSIFVRMGNFTIFSNLIKNEFPAYRRVIPTKQSETCVFSRTELENALRRVSLLVENKYKKVKFSIYDNKMLISTEDSEMGSGREIISCQYSGEELFTAMNYSYILSPLKVMDSEYAKFSFTEGNRPFTLTSEPESDYLHVIMPMNLN